MRTELQPPALPPGARERLELLSAAMDCAGAGIVILEFDPRDAAARADVRALKRSSWSSKDRC